MKEMSILIILKLLKIGEIMSCSPNLQDLCKNGTITGIDPKMMATWNGPNPCKISSSPLIINHKENLIESTATAITNTSTATTNITTTQQPHQQVMYMELKCLFISTLYLIFTESLITHLLIRISIFAKYYYKPGIGHILVFIFASLNSSMPKKNQYHEVKDFDSNEANLSEDWTTCP